MSVTVCIENNQGQFTNWDCRACFGFMTFINSWNNSFSIAGDEMPGFDADGEPVWIGPEDDRDYDDDGEDSPLDGFASNQLAKIYWDVRGSEDDYVAGFERLYHDLFEILKQPMYSNVEMSEKDGRIILSSKVGNLPMDQTIVPMVALRNALYGSYNLFREEGLTPYQAVIMCNVFYIAKDIFKVSNVYPQHGDSTLFDPSYLTAHTLAKAMSGAEPNYWQPVWGSNDGGYHRYGTLNEYSVVDTLEDVPIILPVTKYTKGDDRRLRGTLKTCLFFGDVFDEEHMSLTDAMHVQGSPEMLAEAKKLYQESLELLKEYV